MRPTRFEQSAAARLRDVRGRSSRQLRHAALRVLRSEQFARMRVAAVVRAVDERPQRTCRFSFLLIAAKSRAPIANRQFAAQLKPFAASSPHGNGSSSGSQRIFEQRQLAPVTLRGSSSAATACNRGSAGAPPPSSSSSSRSRHHASRIGAEAWIAARRNDVGQSESRFHSAAKAGPGRGSARARFAGPGRAVAQR